MKNISVCIFEVKQAQLMYRTDRDIAKHGIYNINYSPYQILKPRY